MNKETLQSYNERLNTTNINLNNVLDVVSKLPEVKGTLDINANGEVDVTNYKRAIVGVKDDLNEELGAYDAELTEQETTLEEVVEALKVKGVIPSKYKPKFLSFSNYKGTDLTEETKNLDTSLITDMSNLFAYCTYVTSADFSEWDTSNVTNMYYMFYDFYSMPSLDLTSFDTRNVTNMAGMFGRMVNAKRLNLSSFDTSKVTNMNAMFYLCMKLEYLDIRNFTFSSVTSYSSIFDSMKADCEIIVKDDTAKAWVLARRSDLTNVKTVAEVG